jgi:Flp pilus assembly CpaF family ATPase
VNTVDTLSDYDIRVQRERGDLLAAVDGPIAHGLADNSVTEILVNPDGTVLHDKLFGKMEIQRARMHPARVEGVIATIAGLLKKPLSPEMGGDWTLEGELPFDGSRIEALLPPVSPRGPVLSVRKHRKQGVDGWPALTLDDYDICQSYRETLDRIIEEQLNLLIVGSTSSGKTTFGGAVLNRVTKLYEDDRIVTAEDASELYCESRNYVDLHTTPEVSMRALVKHSVRLRPDRFIIGEVRGIEAIDMITGMGTGHSGFSTVHGPTIAGGLARVHYLTRLDGNATLAPEAIVDAIDYALLMKRDPVSGSRYVADLAKVADFRASRFLTEPVKR